MLLTVLLFNCCGYLLVHSYLESKANQQLVSKLDAENYDESALFSIKIPATHTTGYSQSSPEFTRMDGQIEINGTQYNFVKRRLYNDSIEMLCISNTKANQLKQVSNDYFQLVNDLKHPGGSKKTDTHHQKGFSDEYCSFNTTMQVHFAASSANTEKYPYSEALSSAVLQTQEHPPQSLEIASQRPTSQLA